MLRREPPFLPVLRGNNAAQRASLSSCSLGETGTAMRRLLSLLWENVGNSAQTVLRSLGDYRLNLVGREPHCGPETVNKVDKCVEKSGKERFLPPWFKPVSPKGWSRMGANYHSSS